jgi:uncharacterized DUF497 family protein
MGLAKLENVCKIANVLFEYDPAKSRANADKHGINFKAVQRMWDGVVIAAPARSIAEDRLMAIGLIEGKFWTVIATLRGSVLRIISARRSRQNEIKLYQDHSSQP